jgi:iron complex transport system substrate-binding protein
MVGADNLYADLDVESTRVTAEEACAAARRGGGMLVRDAETADCGAGLNRPAWQATPAFRHRQVFVLSEAFFGRPGPRLVEGLVQLTGLV